MQHIAKLITFLNVKT